GRVGEQLIEAEPADYVAHGGLADLIDCVIDILDHDHRFFRIGNVIIGDRGDVDRDVVLGDDFLRGDLHRDGAHRNAQHLLQRHEDQREARPAHALEFTEEEDHAALVLAQHAYGGDEIDDDDNDDNLQKGELIHDGPFRDHALGPVSDRAPETER